MFRYLLILALILLAYASPAYAIENGEDETQSYSTPPLVRVLKRQVEKGEERYDELLLLTENLAKELRREREKSKEMRMQKKKPGVSFFESDVIILDEQIISDKKIRKLKTEKRLCQPFKKLGVFLRETFFAEALEFSKKYHVILNMTFY